MEPNLETIIRETLKKCCGERKSQREVAESLGISQSYLNRLLSNRYPVSGLTVATLEKMFPRMVIYLNGDAVTATNSGTVNGVVGLNSGTVNAASEGSLRLRIMEAVIGLDIPPDALQAVLKTIKEVR